VNKLNEKGFTLIEMLLVLAIVMTITSSVIFIATSKYVEIEEKRFFRQFQLDVQSIQAVAIAEEKYTYIIFLNVESKYVAKSANTILFESEMPAGYRVSTESNLKEVGFHPNGSVKEFGNLIFETKNGTKKLILYIGRGRMNYEE
jgi:prepilin-type N-terminal cleavage/methylation domain-containing protein